MSHSALLIIDMITDLNFPEAADMTAATMSAGEAISRLRAEANKLSMPVVYVNDNFDDWHSDRSQIVARCATAPAAAELVGLLEPAPDDHFVVKPRFSGFYATNLPVLLPRLGVTRLILTGIAADICVLFTAADAHMREYDIWVPSDCVASFDQDRTRWALEIMEHSMGAEVRSSRELRLREWLELGGAS